MNLPAGTRIGPYEILSVIGAGGMGEVYRARDTKLNRDVAIKVLLPSVVADPDRIARFQREAQVLASLNHPNIANIYGAEEANGVTALVLELVEGEDLSQRIARGPIALDEALPIARQVAEALAAAHELGIIHRDLKPANVKVRPDGTVKVLDFGLAKATEPPGSSAAANVANSPTLTSPAMMTGVGVILGTAAYMSPEQAKGRVADKRSDVWAFGCVLYEMLTGRRAFDGEDIADVLGAVMRLEPDWEALSTDVPQPVRTLLQACLLKDRRLRVADISTCLFVLGGANLGAVSNAGAIGSQHRRPLWLRAVAPVVAAFATAVAVSTFWYVMRPGQLDPAHVSRLLISPVGNAAITLTGTNTIGITDDGLRVLYIGNRGTQVFVRSLDALEGVPVFTSDIGALSMPFASPDNRWIGFSTNGVLTKVAITGGPAVPLTTLDGTARGATWSNDGTIIFATSNRNTGLQKVGADGGNATVLTQPDASKGEGDHVWPRLLPGGRALLFTILPLTGGLDAAQVAVLNLDTGARTILVRGGANGSYISGNSSRTGKLDEVGYLVYAFSNTLRAVEFDLVRMATRGDHVQAVPDIVVSPTGAVHAVVAPDGTLAYVRGGAGAEYSGRALVWVDRKGRETVIPAPPHRFVYPRLSPDGSRIAAIAVDQEVDVWIWNFEGATLRRATLDPGTDHSPVWTPSGLDVIFSSERSGIRNLFKQLANTTGPAERLIESTNRQNASAVSPDGRLLIYTETAPGTGDDVMQLQLDGSHRVTPLIHSSAAERNGVISPNGRWIAYESNASGRFEIFVRPFPEVTKDEWPVSNAGGTRPLWTRSGDELIYVAPSGALMRVGVRPGASWSATAPSIVVKEGYVTTPTVDLGVTYDISADGERFLLIRGNQSADLLTAPANVVVVQNWPQELKKLVH